MDIQSLSTSADAAISQSSGRAGSGESLATERRNQQENAVQREPVQSSTEAGVGNNLDIRA